jgi:hypothetical protein
MVATVTAAVRGGVPRTAVVVRALCELRQVGVPTTSVTQSRAADLCPVGDGGEISGQRRKIFGLRLVHWAGN